MNETAKAALFIAALLHYVCIKPLTNSSDSERSCSPTHNKFALRKHTLKYQQNCDTHQAVSARIANVQVCPHTDTLRKQ